MHARRWGLLYLALGLLVWLTAVALHEPAQPEAIDLSSEREDPDAPTLRGAGVEPVEPSRAAAAAAPVSAPTPAAFRFDGSVLFGKSPFQRRMATGTYLLRLEQALAEEQVTAEQVLRELSSVQSRGLLALDGYYGILSDLRARLSPADLAGGLVARLTEPRRDPAALRLNVLEMRESEIGEGSLLRVWTLGEAHPRSEIEAGDDLLRRLIALGGDASDDGYDVLATPLLGKEVFPEAWVFRLPFRLAGFHMPDDHLCCIGTRFGSTFRTRLIRHELLHAWAEYSAPDWSHRFVEEGLAEYVSCVESGDAGLQIPPDRFRHQFAALLEILGRLRARGVSVEGASLSRLARASPIEFYSMATLGYLLAQACVAHAGGDAVEAAVRAGSEYPLLERIDALTWSTLLAFLREHAEGGDARKAVVIEDVGVRTDPVRDLRARARGRNAPEFLRGLGFAFPAGYPPWLLLADLGLSTPLDAQSRARLNEVLARIGEADRLVVVSEATKALEAPSRMVDEAVVRGAGGRVETRLDLVAVVRRILPVTDDGDPPPVAAWHHSIEDSAFPPTLQESGVWVGPLGNWLAKQRRPDTALVLFVASKLETHHRFAARLAAQMGVGANEVDPELLQSTLTAAYRSVLATARVSVGTVLVVDLADGASDAKVLAAALANHVGPYGQVAYWNPQQPLR